MSTDLAHDPCPAGHVCPAGAEVPDPCPTGTYNPHTGMDDLGEDCLISPEGYYTIEASTNLTGVCAPGYYCPARSTGPEQVSSKHVNSNSTWENAKCVTLSLPPVSDVETGCEQCRCSVGSMRNT